MKRALMVVGVVVAGLMLTGARPGTEQQLVQQLNGQPTRLVMPDGGASGIYSTTGARACMPLSGLRNGLGAVAPANVFVFVPRTPGGFCLRPSIGDPYWDGGCNLINGDLNSAVPVTVGVPQYLTPSNINTTFCFVGDAGSSEVPVWWVE